MPDKLSNFQKVSNYNTTPNLYNYANTFGGGMSNTNNNMSLWENSYYNGFLQGLQQLDQQKQQKSEFAQNAETGVNIANSVMNAIGGISNIALGWATYAEQKKNSEMQRKLASKQLENLEEIMKQRKEELERLNRVRGNTQRAFSSNTTVTRSVL